VPLSGGCLNCMNPINTRSLRHGGESARKPACAPFRSTARPVSCARTSPYVVAGGQPGRCTACNPMRQRQAGYPVAYLITDWTATPPPVSVMATGLTAPGTSTVVPVFGS